MFRASRQTLLASVHPKIAFLAIFRKVNYSRRLVQLFSCLVLVLFAGLLTASVPAAEPASKTVMQKNGYRTPVDEKLKELLIEAIEDTSGFTDRFDAEVWLLDMSTRMAQQVPDPQERMEILKHVHQEATRAELQPELVLSVIEVESNFDRYAISWVGARGLMQIMPFWLKEIGHPKDNLFDIQTNLRFGCTILSYYLKIEKGNLSRALARYNGSLGKTHYPEKVFRAMNNKWFKAD